MLINTDRGSYVSDEGKRQMSDGLRSQEKKAKRREKIIAYPRCNFSFPHQDEITNVHCVLEFLAKEYFSYRAVFT